MVGWILAAVAGLGLASWGVALVGRSVTDRRPAPLTAAQVDARLTDLSTTTAPTTTDTTGDTSTTTSTTTTTVAPGGATTTVAPGGTTTTVPRQDQSPTTTASATITRAYPVQGGSVTLRFEPGRVSVVVANPAPGFDVEVEPDHGNGVRVEFESDYHRSRVVAWWDGGPQDVVTEEARSHESESESD